MIAGGASRRIVDLKQDGSGDQSLNFGRGTDLAQVCDWDRNDGADETGFVRRANGGMTFTTNPAHVPGGAGGEDHGARQVLRR